MTPSPKTELEDLFARHVEPSPSDAPPLTTSETIDAIDKALKAKHKNFSINMWAAANLRLSIAEIKLQFTGTTDANLITQMREGNAEATALMDKNKDKVADIFKAHAELRRLAKALKNSIPTPLSDNDPFTEKQQPETLSK